MLAPDDAVALAWAIKDLCYAAWSTAPQRAVRAGAALRHLRTVSASALPPATLAELDALVAWTAGISHLVQGEMDAAVVQLDAADAALQAIGRPQQAAQTQVAKIMALAMLGRHDAAATCGAAVQRRLLGQGDLRAAGRVSLNLANLHLRADRFGPAAERYGEAAALFERLHDHEHVAMAEIGLADTCTALGRFNDAADSCQRAGERAASHGFPVLRALAVESQALLDLVRGRYREALAGLEDARRRYATLGMPQHLAIAEKQLADAYLELHLLPEALAGYDAALARFDALQMRVDHAWTAMQQGRAFALAGRHTAAGAALALANQSFSALHNNVGSAEVCLARAELALSTGDAAAALLSAREAQALFSAAGLVARCLRADTVLAQALLHLGDAALAHRQFDAALATARTHALLPVQLRCLAGRAMAALAQGDEPAAREDFEAAALLFEDQCRSLPGDELRSAFQSDHLQPFEQLLGMDLEAHQRGRLNASQVLVQLDRCRARCLAGRLHDASAWRIDGEPMADAQRDLRAHLSWLFRRLRRNDAADADAAQTTTLTAELRAAERRLLEQLRRDRLAATATRCAPASPPALGHELLDVPALQAALAADDALVAYGCHGAELFACVVDRHQVQVVRHLAAWPEVTVAIAALQLQLETLRHGQTPVLRHISTLEVRALQHLQHLHAMVWRPLATALAGRSRVLVVPHGELARLPFAALHDGKRCVAEQVQLACSPSARMALHGLGIKPLPAHSVLALGESSQLPHAGHEARRIAGLLATGRACVGPDATLANLLAHAASADVLHLACHAQFRSDNPAFSALVLHDGALTAEAVENLRVPAALVVLSACDTALHGSTGADEMLGLPRAFLLAGASRVVAALWPVDDARTAALMDDFYAGLRRGQPPAAALRHAQLAARQRDAHPFYWAAFCLLGAW